MELSYCNMFDSQENIMQISSIFYQRISGGVGFKINLIAAEYSIKSFYKGLNVANKVTISIF